jgi:uncharacterized membrane protein (UPF0127 family)
MILYNSTNEAVISNRVLQSYKTLSRMKGLLGRESLDENYCMHIRPCNSIHTFFMRFPIDVLFLDRDMKVVYLMEDVVRGRMSPFVRKAYSVIELPSGHIQRAAIGLGDSLILK